MGLCWLLNSKPGKHVDTLENVYTHVCSLWEKGVLFFHYVILNAEEYIFFFRNTSCVYSCCIFFLKAICARSAALHSKLASGLSCKSNFTHVGGILSCLRDTNFSSQEAHDIHMSMLSSGAVSLHGGRALCLETFPLHPKMPSQQDHGVLSDWPPKEQINQSDPVKGRYVSCF